MVELFTPSDVTFFTNKVLKCAYSSTKTESRYEAFFSPVRTYYKAASNQIGDAELTKSDVYPYT